MSDQEEELTRRTGLDADERRERATKASQQAHTIEVYVARVVKNAPKLTPDLIEQLRAVIGPVLQPDVYAAGIRTGAQLAREAVIRSLNEVAA